MPATTPQLYPLTRDQLLAIAKEAFSFDPEKTRVWIAGSGALVMVEHTNHGSSGYLTLTMVVHPDGDVDGEEEGGC